MKIISNNIIVIKQDKKEIKRNNNTKEDNKDKEKEKKKNDNAKEDNKDKENEKKRNNNTKVDNKDKENNKERNNNTKEDNKDKEKERKRNNNTKENNKNEKNNIVEDNKNKEKNKKLKNNTKEYNKIKDEKKEKNINNNTEYRENEEKKNKINKTEDKKNREHKEIKQQKKEDNSYKNEEKNKTEKEKDNKNQNKTITESRNTTHESKKRIQYKPAEAMVYTFEQYEFNETKNQVSFHILFVPTHNKIEAEKLKISLKIKYKNSLRDLEDNIKKKEVVCKKAGSNNRQVKYHCEFTPLKTIENIELIKDDLKFIEQKIDIKAWSPFAIKEMKNIQKIGKEIKFKKKLYIFESAEKSQDKKDINIIGKINDKVFNHDSLSLTISSFNKSKEKTIDCNIEKTREKYKLSCKPKEDIEGDLNGATGVLENEILIINFKKGKNSSIKFTPVKEEKKEIKKEGNKTVIKIENVQNSYISEEKNILFSKKTISYILIYIVLFLIIIIVFILLCRVKKKEEKKYQKYDDSMDVIIDNNQLEINN